MGRLIDVDEIPFFVEEDGAVVAYKADIEQIPSAQPEPQWIPCNKKMPEENIDVYVTIDYGDEEPYVDIASYQNIYVFGNKKGWISNSFAKIESRYVTAWKPLDEPWRGEEHETD